jgi:hypothetical protein
MQFILDRKTIEPKDIFFYVGHEKVYDEDNDLISDGDVYVVMCPSEYFAQYNCVYDRHLGIKHLLPSGVSECQECLFDTNLSLQDTYAALIDLGFAEDPAFSKWCSDHDPFV